VILHHLLLRRVSPCSLSLRVRSPTPAPAFWSNRTLWWAQAVACNGPYYAVHSKDCVSPTRPAPYCTVCREAHHAVYRKKMCQSSSTRPPLSRLPGGRYRRCNTETLHLLHSCAPCPSGAPAAPPTDFSGLPPVSSPPGPACSLGKPCLFVPSSTNPRSSAITSTPITSCGKGEARLEEHGGEGHFPGALPQEKDSANSYTCRQAIMTLSVIRLWSIA